MIVFLVLTTIINIFILIATYDPSMMGFAAGGFSELQGLEKAGWIVVLGLPVIAAAGALLPWFLQRSKTIAIFLALLPIAILGTTLFSVQAGLVS